jgi:hypothetical protein
MAHLVTILTLAGLCLIGYGIWLAWPPLVFVACGITVLRISWSFNEEDDK